MLYDKLGKLIVVGDLVLVDSVSENRVLAHKGQMPRLVHRNFATQVLEVCRHNAPCDDCGSYARAKLELDNVESLVSGCLLTKIEGQDFGEEERQANRKKADIT